MTQNYVNIQLRKVVISRSTRSTELKEGEVAVMRGIVKWFNNEKGYGFIQYTDEEDIFVHYSAINQDGYKTLAEGQLVEFQLIETSKGLQALNVTTVKELQTTK